MTKQHKAAQMKLLRGDVRSALFRANPYCSPLATPTEVENAIAQYRRLRRLHSIYARNP